MKEFCIFIKCGKGSPYRTLPYSSFNEVKEDLLHMTEDFEYKDKFFYIDNDFFENKFPLTMGSIYYQVQEREVTEWRKYNRNTNTKIKITFNIAQNQTFVQIGIELIYKTAINLYFFKYQAYSCFITAYIQLYIYLFYVYILIIILIYYLYINILMTF